MWRVHTQLNTSWPTERNPDSEYIMDKLKAVSDILDTPHNTLCVTTKNLTTTLLYFITTHFHKTENSPHHYPPQQHMEEYCVFKDVCISLSFLSIPACFSIS